ncbi:MULTISPECIES: hypothetical protein [unclassified Pseudomonas]|uniref:hypothetical protein n=1 Tax=unclassified Pseudomonas TaxID=196821 RepID=UPI000C8814A1|nr:MULTISPECIES: hypothetical protein [unclassified Pseudomonas]PMX27526.1 hypothetical protein C1Y23_08645 [Pseudomonas sp. GW460-12]PMX37176.1 hypothetical protein C1Y24_04040 [Pseudomonas sp. MPR-R2A4]PMX43115.1 hypothetical protein C1Y26_03950 [Pseudomonas sp. MPR-R2A7]PMX55363.1 hypothetical protein C1Y17_04120 [Pseudomonas sp. MPR-R2A6]PMX92871.1 hypothetical protein C1Y21_05815 [Pseudomonas sp. MPR-R2A3]
MYATLIDPVNEALRQILNIAVQFDRTNAEREKIRAVLRKLLVIREMHATYFICVGGTQGAGKTHLLRELYGLDDWLQDNPGRGECRPLFILERDCEASYARGVDEYGEEHEINQETLAKELRSFSTGERFLLLRLYVPRRHFSDGFGFLLLPGYERLSRTNSLWQEEMRDTLKHAMGSIMVTNANALATNATNEVLVDMLENALQGRQPIITIGRTEGKSDDERDTLRLSAAEACDVPAEELDRILCVGRGEEYRARWVPQLIEALAKYAQVPESVHHQRLTDLRSIVELELEAAVTLLESLVEDAGARASAQDALIDSILNKFRQSVISYRKKYQKSLHHYVDQYARQATASAKKAYGDEEEGWGNKLRTAKDFFLLNASETEQRFIDRINLHWENQAGQTPVDATYLALTHVANDLLALGHAPKEHLDAQALLSLRNEDQPGQYLGYEKADGGAISPLSNRVDPQLLQKHVCLLLNETSSENHLDTSTTRTQQFNTALQHLPALTMEYLRMSQGIALCRRNVIDTSQLVNYDPVQLAKDIGETLPKFTQGAQQAIRALLAITAVDLAIDGSFDVIPILAGGAATGLGATLSVAATGLMGLGFIGYKAASSVHHYDVAKRNFIGASIEHFKDHLIETSLEHYDELMDMIETRIQRNLSLAYGVDIDQFAERDALARSLRALDVSRRNLETEIDRAHSRYLA